MNEEQLLLRQLLEDAINDVYAEPRFILQHDMQDLEGLEQSFAFRVGLNLHERLKNTDYSLFDLDAEYNKSLGLSKMLEEFENGIRPDLILHQRGTHENNILAVEFKGHWNKFDKKDKRKLIGLTSSNGDYQYRLGVFVHIGKILPTI